MKKLTFLLLALPFLCGACTGPDTPDKKEETATERDVTGQEMITVKSDLLRVRQDLTRGGAICSVSRAATADNIVNIADEGRYIQQSYYSGRRVDRRAEGQGAAWSPWNWNPIQVGDYKRNRAKILKATVKGNTSYVKCIPMQWDMNNMPAEAEMEQWTTVEGNTILVKNRLTCHRTDDIYGDDVNCSQEIPAVYPISRLKLLFTYQGSEPWTNAPTKQLDVVQLVMNDGGGGTWGYYNDISEQWMAFVDSSLWGMGVYSPSATQFAAGRSDSNTNGGPDSPSTSYIAPLRRETLKKNCVMEYEYYLIVDKLENIRKRVYEIKGVK